MMKMGRKWLGSADCDTIYTIYLSFCTQTADLNLFRGTHCSKRHGDKSKYTYLTLADQP